MQKSQRIAQYYYNRSEKNVTQHADHFLDSIHNLCTVACVTQAMFSLMR